ncbi:hypothetical protein [Portibacter lacus]|uniref:Uncharacterized protein n=1 Tax=Portibacter lacus TaxID=1099794 RepID=A0AA37SRC2_9BACT|nr:hypothetical protein [Portibacter lacus]GLR16893.1 hypothetical protein GCM10007940_15080 [Portibacter lacus]
MKEVYHISGSGNNSGLKIFESEGNSLIIKIPKVLVTRSWRYLVIGIILLLLSIVIPFLVHEYIHHFLFKVGFFFASFTTLVIGGGLAMIATWEIRSAIEIKLTEDKLTIFHPAFFSYRSLTRSYLIEDVNKLYVNKVRALGKEKYSLMIDDLEPLDERLIKGFYVPDQALWIAKEVNERIGS